ncbi:conserved hypothetical protein [Ricinus communis]|uniref:Uncharacterized protein n=1 Tax=Ricinus communis TaxID=3988 RepID=B9T284_RICCO|nr:conserved hypothetical protein [Ricinus communis]
MTISSVINRPNQILKDIVNFNPLMFPCMIRPQKTFPETFDSLSVSVLDIDENDKNLTELALQNLNVDPPESAYAAEAVRSMT